MSIKNCSQENQLSAYLDGELSLDTARDFEQHLESCRHCSESLEICRSSEEAMLQALPEMTPPAYLKAQLFNRIDSELEGRRWSGFLAAFRESFRPRAWVYACAPVVLLAVIISALHLRQGIENGRILAEIDRSRVTLEARTHAGNPFSIDVNGAPLRSAGKNPFEAYLNGR